MESLPSNSNEDHAPQQFDKEHMQTGITQLSATEIECNETQYSYVNSSICLSNKISKSSDPDQNVHIVQFEITKVTTDGDFHGTFGLTSETNVPMLNQECEFYM